MTQFLFIFLPYEKEVIDITSQVIMWIKLSIIIWMMYLVFSHFMLLLILPSITHVLVGLFENKTIK